MKPIKLWHYMKKQKASKPARKAPTKTDGAVIQYKDGIRMWQLRGVNYPRSTQYKINQVWTWRCHLGKTFTLIEFVYESQVYHCLLESLATASSHLRAVMDFVLDKINGRVITPERARHLGYPCLINDIEDDVVSDGNDDQGTS